MEHPVEPPSWSTNGSSPVATDQEAAADGQAGASAVPPPPPPPVPPPAEPQPAESTVTPDSPAYASASPYGGGDSYGQHDAYGQPPFGQEGSYMPSSSYGYGQGSGFTPSAGTARDEADAPAAPYPADTSYTRPASDTTAYRTQPARAAAAAPAAAAQRRRANLVLARLEPWSVMKFSFLMSLVAWVVLFVAVALLYFALSGLGVFHAIQTTLSGVTSSQGTGGFDLGKYISASKVLGYTMLLGAVNIVLITALSTIGAMIYNLVTHLGGGIEVTLRETD
ncbi:MAG: DUF3566 domain-containing protein [Gemmatimonadota bacterium]